MTGVARLFRITLRPGDVAHESARVEYSCRRCENGSHIVKTGVGVWTYERWQEEDSVQVDVDLILRAMSERRKMSRGATPCTRASKMKVSGQSLRFLMPIADASWEWMRWLESQLSKGGQS